MVLGRAYRGSPMVSCRGCDFISCSIHKLRILGFEGLFMFEVRGERVAMLGGRCVKPELRMIL